MTKEQEVIKYIETRIKICNENADICDDNDFDEEATYLREESYMLETVLSMLKEKDKLINEQLKENVKLQKELNEENKRCMILANNDKFKEQVIDLIVEELWGEFYLTYMNGYGINSKEELKQYFAGLVEKE